MRDGETVIIGGLSQDSDLDANTTIPVLGAAFRNKDASCSRNESIILVTPQLFSVDGSLERARRIDMQTNRLAPVATTSP